MKKLKIFIKIIIGLIIIFLSTLFVKNNEEISNFQWFLVFTFLIFGMLIFIIGLIKFLNSIQKSTKW
jgi:hypothetical protein